MRPSAVNSPTRLMLIWLQMLVLRRGVTRCLNESVSMLFRIPSIQPKHNDSSTTCCHVTLGLPVAFFQKPIHSSFADSWFFSSHFRYSSGDLKKSGFDSVPGFMANSLAHPDGRKAFTTEAHKGAQRNYPNDADPTPLNKKGKRMCPDHTSGLESTFVRLRAPLW